MSRVWSAFFACTLAFASVLIAPPQPAAAYGGVKLPYPRGLSYQVTQPPGQYQSCPGPSHCGTADFWAYDFGLADGNWTSVVKHGRVIRFEMGQTLGGCLESYANNANYLVVDHGDGYSSIYWHLKYATNLVSPNEFVYQGKPLAGADNSGWSCGTHLHFAVETTPPAGSSITNSVQVIFDEVGEPALGSYPVSQTRVQWSATYLAGSEWVSLTAGQRYTTTGQWRNSGYDIWQFNGASTSARLGTWGPEPGQDQQSRIGGAPSGCLYAATNWNLCTRIRPTTDSVAPDDIGWFQFDLIGPPTAGVYKLHLRPLIEGVLWMEDYGVFWQVTRP